ncbi:hypothetical protein [Aneurinibacillus aneurinilyticus]|uniref:DUF7210 family protein n=1 Tax=Aneurinibacillus aneurinilyticus TaxID=1391 RepID=UPI0023F25587|nr:hypothetical protein [Aneurinibacillus aneurinilyticus]
MYIKTVINVKYEGTMHPPGTEIDVRKEIGENLVVEGYAIEIEKPPTKSRGTKNDEQSTKPKGTKNDEQPTDGK